MRAFLHPLQHLSPLLGCAALGILAAAIVAIAWIVRRRRPSAEEIERRRRDQLAAIGRITDGYLTDARTLEGDDSLSPTPDVIFYTYGLGGVIYNCAQDVSTLPDRVRGYRLDQPVQVRYDPRNPGNSILVSEAWNGLRLSPAHPLTPVPTEPQPPQNSQPLEDAGPLEKS